MSIADKSGLKVGSTTLGTHAAQRENRRMPRASVRAVAARHIALAVTLIVLTHVALPAWCAFAQVLVLGSGGRGATPRPAGEIRDHSSHAGYLRASGAAPGACFARAVRMVACMHVR